MTTHRELAEAVNAALEEAFARCDESLSVVKEEECLGALNVYARLRGAFLAYTYTNVLAPLWAQHPDLVPAGMRDRFVEPEPTLSPESRAAITAFLVSAEPALRLAREYAATIPDPPFGGFPEVAATVAAIEDFLANPRFRDERREHEPVDDDMDGDESSDEE